MRQYQDRSQVAIHQSGEFPLHLAMTVARCYDINVTSILLEHDFGISQSRASVGIAELRCTIRNSLRSSQQKLSKQGRLRVEDLRTKALRLEKYVERILMKI